MGQQMRVKFLLSPTCPSARLSAYLIYINVRPRWCLEKWNYEPWKDRLRDLYFLCFEKGGGATIRPACADSSPPGSASAAVRDVGAFSIRAGASLAAVTAAVPVITSFRKNGNIKTYMYVK